MEGRKEGRKEGRTQLSTAFCGAWYAIIVKIWKITTRGSLMNSSKFKAWVGPYLVWQD